MVSKTPRVWELGVSVEPKGGGNEGGIEMTTMKPKSASSAPAPAKKSGFLKASS